VLLFVPPGPRVQVNQTSKASALASIPPENRDALGGPELEVIHGF